MNGGGAGSLNAVESERREWEKKREWRRVRSLSE